jgi:hypothetical protein
MADLLGRARARFGLGSMLWRYAATFSFKSRHVFRFYLCRDRRRPAHVKCGMADVIHGEWSLDKRVALN